MPRINIREIDNTGSDNNQSYVENLVLIPGVRIRKFTKQDSVLTVTSKVEGLYTDAATFLKDVEAALATYDTTLHDPESLVDSTKVQKPDLTTIKDYGFISTCYLLAQGLPVYYVPAYNETTLISAYNEGTGDTMSITPETYLTYEETDTLTGEVTIHEVLQSEVDEVPQAWQCVETAHYMFDYDTFTDKGLYDIRFITTAGLNKEIFISKGLTAAAKRSDAVLITSVPDKGEQGVTVRYVNSEGNYQYVVLPKTKLGTSGEYYISDSGDITLKAGDTKKTYALNTAEKINSWIQSKLGTLCLNKIKHQGYTWSASEGLEQIGKYGAIFTPNFTTSLTISGTSKDYVYSSITLPAELNYLAAYSNMIVGANDYLAVSGSEYGVSPLNPIPVFNLGDADVDLLEAREQEDTVTETVTANKYNLYIGTGATSAVEGLEVTTNSVSNHVACNPICNINPYGNIIWGNRTMYALQAPENGSSSTIQLTASSFLNIRNLIIDIKKRLYRSARSFTFAPNDDTLWINFKASITPLLENMIYNRGIRSYRISRVSTTKKALVAARVTITPIEAVEDFDLTVDLSDSISVQE